MEAVVAAFATISMLYVSLESKMAGLLPVEIGRGQPQIMREYIAPQTLDHLPPDPARDSSSARSRRLRAA